MKIGIVGLPGTGKTTLFRAIAGGGDDAASHGGSCLRTVPVPDERLDWLKALWNPKKYTPATVAFCDFGPATSPDHWNAMVREADALVYCLRAFDATGLPPADPAGERNRLDQDFALADLAVVEGRIERADARLKKAIPAKEKEKVEEEIELLQRLKARLEAGQDLIGLDLSPEHAALLQTYTLVRAKPVIQVWNLPEGEAEKAPDDESGAIRLSAKIEMELMELDPDERRTFMNDLGIRELARGRLIRRGYRALRLHSFLTDGEKEVRAWTIPLGATAVDAAGVIHSDLARGFIKAEVIAFEDLKRAGTVRAAKAQNLYRLEGRDYVVKDGDIIEIRFSV